MWIGTGHPKSQRAAFWHGVARIDRQIDDHLLELDRVTFYRTGIGGQFKAKCDVLT